MALLGRIIVIAFAVIVASMAAGIAIAINVIGIRLVGSIIAVGFPGERFAHKIRPPSAQQHGFNGTSA